MKLPEMSRPAVNAVESLLTYANGESRTVFASDVEVPFPDGRLIVSRTDLAGFLTLDFTAASSDGFMLTPSGALYAFSRETPDPSESALQALLTPDRSLDMAAWSAADSQALVVLPIALENGWVQPLRRPLQGPDARLDDFLPPVIASLSGERRAVLASDGGFCLCRAGVNQYEADTLCAAAADYSDFAARQARRGWHGASRYVAFHLDPDFLLPSHAFLPFWVDGAGYWLIVMGEPLLNNPALVELLWGIKQAGARFRVQV